MTVNERIAELEREWLGMRMLFGHWDDFVIFYVERLGYPEGDVLELIAQHDAL